MALSTHACGWQASRDAVLHNISISQPGLPCRETLGAIDNLHGGLSNAPACHQPERAPQNDPVGESWEQSNLVTEPATSETMRRTKTLQVLQTVPDKCRLDTPDGHAHQIRNSQPRRAFLRSSQSARQLRNRPRTVSRATRRLTHAGLSWLLEDPASLFQNCFRRRWNENIS